MSAIDKTSFFQIIECLNETNKEDLIQTLLNVAAQAMAFDLLKNNLSDSNMQKTVALSSDSVLTNKTVISENDKKVRNAKKGVVKFTKQELNVMPISFKKYFIVNNQIVKYRFYRGMFQARYHRNGKNIEVASQSYELMKKKFIEKLLDETPSYDLPESVKNKKVRKFGEYGEEWLTIKEKTTKPSTFKEYSRLFRNDLKPKFGNTYLDRITRSTIQEYLFSFVEQGKHRTAEKLKLQLTCIFDMAADDFNIPSPMKNIVLPYYEAQKGSAFKKDEERRLVEYCKNNPNVESSSALLILLYFGIRQSELATMKNIDDRWLEVETSKERMGRDIVIRKIPFTPMVKEVLQYIDFEKARNTKQRTIASTMRRQFPNHHPHELRYTYITRCKECGVNPEVVMLWDGHEADKDVKASRVDRGYTDFSEEYQLKEAEKVNYDI